MMGLLDGKVAIITGAARGQGAAEARRFVNEGAAVVITDVLDGSALAVELGDRARFVRHDVTQQADWDAVVAHTLAAFGRIDILINNAGVHLSQPIETTDEASFRTVLDVNLVSAFLGIRAVLPSMKLHGGSIINIASIAGLRSVTLSSGYVTSKFALRGLTRSAATELGVYGIRVNAILPGVIRTPMTDPMLAGRSDDLASTIPMKRIGQPDDVAALALFLASDASTFITGADHVIDGGSMA